MISIGIGMNQSFRENLMQYGSFTVINMDKHQSNYDEKGNYSGEKKQKLDDKILAKVRTIPHIKTVSPVLRLSVKMKSGNYESQNSIMVMDADAFEVFKQAGIFNIEVATRFRREILEKGSSEKESLLYKRFRGQDPTADALIRRAFH